MWLFALFFLQYFQYIFICEMWLFALFFLQFCRTNISKYGYFEVFSKSHRLRDNKSWLYYYSHAISLYFIHAHVPCNLFTCNVFQISHYNKGYIWAASSEKVPSNVCKMCRFRSSYACAKYQQGPSCSKLTMSLVNNSFKFTSSDTQKCWNFLLKKCE